MLALSVPVRLKKWHLSTQQGQQPTTCWLACLLCSCVTNNSLYQQLVVSIFAILKGKEQESPSTTASHSALTDNAQPIQHDELAKKKKKKHQQGPTGGKGVGHQENKPQQMLTEGMMVADSQPSAWWVSALRSVFWTGSSHFKHPTMVELSAAESLKQWLSARSGHVLLNRDKDRAKARVNINLAFWDGGR